MIGEAALSSASITPKLLIDKADYVKEALITYADTECFAQNRHLLRGGSMVMDFAPSVWICLDGSAEIIGDDYNRAITKGEYFFLPYSAERKFTIKGNATLIECLPSKQD